MSAGVMGGIAVAIPITNFITIPAVLIKSTVSHFKRFEKFLKTPEGKEMEHYYQKAANLGHTKAKERLETLKLYK